jgi:hypothetical protein
MARRLGSVALVIAVALIAVAAAILITYRPSFSPFRVTPRVTSFGVAQSQLLVDARQSPLADIGTLGLEIQQLTPNFAQLVSSEQVLGPVARSVGARPDDIGTTVQLVNNVSLGNSDQQGAQASNQILSDARRFAILVRVDPQSFVLQIFTQAPTAAQAVKMATVTSSALRGYLTRLVAREHVRRQRQILLRQLGKPTGGVVDRSITTEATVLLAAVFIATGLIILGWAFRYRRGRRAPMTTATDGS